MVLDEERVLKRALRLVFRGYQRVITYSTSVKKEGNGKTSWTRMTGRTTHLSSRSEDTEAREDEEG